MAIEGKYPNIIKATYDKPTANIILNSEKLKAFPLRSGTRQECTLGPLEFNIVWEFLATTIRHLKVIKGIPVGKEHAKRSLFADDTTIVYKNPKKSTPERLALVSEFGEVAG